MAHARLSEPDVRVCIGKGREGKGIGMEASVNQVSYLTVVTVAVAAREQVS
jgi:hypothetical protein